MSIATVLNTESVNFASVSTLTKSSVVAATYEPTVSAIAINAVNPKYLVDAVSRIRKVRNLTPSFREGGRTALRIM